MEAEDTIIERSQTSIRIVPSENAILRRSGGSALALMV